MGNSSGKNMEQREFWDFDENTNYVEYNISGKYFRGGKYYKVLSNHADSLRAARLLSHIDDYINNLFVNILLCNISFNYRCRLASTKDSESEPYLRLGLTTHVSDGRDMEAFELLYSFFFLTPNHHCFQ